MQITVLGAGAWGTALAAQAALRHPTLLWGRDAAQMAEIAATRRNQRWLVTLKQLLESQSDDYLVAVGALHLVGDQGLVTLLKRAGYSITRK